MNKSAMFSMELFSKHLSPGPSSVQLQVQCTTRQNQSKVWIQHFCTHFTSQTQLTGGFSVLVLNLLPYYLTRIVYEGDNKCRKNLFSLVYLFVVDPHCIQVSWWGAWSVSTRLLYKYYCYSLCKHIIFSVGGWWGDILKVSLFYGIS